MISESITYLEKLSGLFMTVGRSAPRYQVMAVLYPRSKRLQSYLWEYFIIVVHLCHKTAKFARKSALSQISSTLSDSDIKKFQSELELWASSIKEEVTLLTSQKIDEEARESSIFRTIVIKSSSAAAYQKKLETKTRWLDAVSTYDYETTWKQARKKGNTAWFTNKMEYRQWKKGSGNPESDMLVRLGLGHYESLVILGKLGSGKTVLMANIVDDLILTQPKGTVAYFFCRHDISESLRAKTIMGCLVRHLLQQSPNIDKILENLDAAGYLSNNEIGFEHLEQNTLFAGPSFLPHHYFVLDGLDECEFEEREIFTTLLTRLRKKFNLRICISCRTDFNIGTVLSHEQIRRKITVPDNNPDISDFIGAELASRIESGRLSVGDPLIILEIQDALQIGAQGMLVSFPPQYSYDSRI